MGFDLFLLKNLSLSYKFTQDLRFKGLVGAAKLYPNAIKLRNIVGWVERERNIVMGRSTHHYYKFQQLGGCREALPTLQKKRIYA